MDTVLKNLIGTECFIFIDDLINFPALQKNTLRDWVKYCTGSKRLNYDYTLAIASLQITSAILRLHSIRELYFCFSRKSQSCAPVHHPQVC